MMAAVDTAIIRSLHLQRLIRAVTGAPPAEAEVVVIRTADKEV